MMTAKPDPRLGYLTLLAIVSTAFIGLYPLIAPVLAQASTKSIDAGKLLRITTATQGYTTFGGTAYFSTYTRPTSGLNLFTEFGIGGVGSYTLGFASDTVATTMTITSTGQYDLTYTTNGAGTQRVYCPFLKEPTTVTGATYTWNPSTSVATLTTAGAAAVALHWTSTVTTSSGVYTMAQTLSQLLPIIALLALFGAFKYPDERGMLFVTFLIIALAALIAGMLAGWGL
jgi:hypothetical protein